MFSSYYYLVWIWIELWWKSCTETGCTSDVGGNSVSNYCAVSFSQNLKFLVGRVFKCPDFELELDFDSGHRTVIPDRIRKVYMTKNMSKKIFTFVLKHYCSRIRTYWVKNTTNKIQQLLDSDNLGDVRSFWFNNLAKIAQNGLLTV